ncbi:hypothetical protein Poli38472_005268 [Pythium oligandrum]|uniref:Uncharacterized protein n=1 Tax=Pythium oligandrum TaxID=41045 RepID=A0A8K1CG88_PYTOL|nr:hypothetical protein Poli38472_005268 [Pythium oligandrum]|eukprot:TMW62650.1 hypothetical protein Poli38472_005268 [Pythium oligandrum]
MTPPTIIVLSDSSSDEEEKPCAGGLVGSSVYRDALASALAMVSSLDGAPAVHETVVAEPQQKTKKKQVNSFDRRVHEEEVRALGVRAGASTQTKLASRKSVPLEARRPMAERQLPFTNKRTPVVSLSSSSSSSSSDSSSGPESRVLTPRVRARSSSKAPLHKRLRRFDEQQVRSRPDAGIRTEPTPPRIAEPPARPLNVVSPPSPRKNAAVQPHRPPSKKTNKTSSSDSLTAHVHGFRATKRMCRKSVVPAPMVQSASPSSEETTPVRRPRRQLESFFNTDAIAFEDIQAQEAELARLRFEKALLDAIAEDHRREEQHDTGDHATSRVDFSVTVDLCSSSDESDSSMDTADTKSVRSDREHPETAHVVSTTPAESTPVPVALSRISPVPVPSERRSFVPSSNKKKEDSAPKRSERSRQEVSQTKTRVRNVLSIKPPSRSQEFAFLEPRSRTKYQADIPINILSINPRPFSTMAELPLSTFDESGELEQKCVFRASFGRSGPLSTSTLFFESTDDRDKKRSQEHVNYQVRQAIESELPVIRDCYKRRSRAVLSESRMRTLRYIQARNSCRQDQVHVACDANGSMTRRIDDAHAALRSRPVSSPVYIMGQGEVHVRESRIGLLGRVTSLVAIPSISRSTTCVTVKTNARVEDDPILRYTPSSAVEAEVPDAVSASNSLMEYESQSKWKMAAAAVDDEVTEFMLRLVVNECGDSEQVFQALKTVAGLTQPYTDYCALKKMYDSRRVAQRRLADALSLVQLHAHEESKDAALGTINLLASSHLLKSHEVKTLRELLSAPVSSFDAHTVRECLDGDDTKFGLRRTDEYPDLVESYRDLFCRMCYRSGEGDSVQSDTSGVGRH